MSDAISETLKQSNATEKTSRKYIGGKHSDYIIVSRAGQPQAPYLIDCYGNNQLKNNMTKAVDLEGHAKKHYQLKKYFQSEKDELENGDR